MHVGYSFVWNRVCALLVYLANLDSRRRHGHGVSSLAGASSLPLLPVPSIEPVLHLLLCRAANSWTSRSKWATLIAARSSPKVVRVVDRSSHMHAYPSFWSRPIMCFKIEIAKSCLHNNDEATAITAIACRRRSSEPPDTTASTANIS